MLKHPKARTATDNMQGARDIVNAEPFPHREMPRRITAPWPRSAAPVLRPATSACAMEPLAGHVDVGPLCGYTAARNGPDSSPRTREVGGRAASGLLCFFEVAIKRAEPVGTPRVGGHTATDHKGGFTCRASSTGAVWQRTMAATLGGNATPISWTAGGLFGLRLPLVRRVATHTPGRKCLRPRRQHCLMRSAERDVAVAPRERYQCPTAVRGSVPVVAGRSRVGGLGAVARSTLPRRPLQ